MEFLNPFVNKDYLSIQHIERYKFAIRVIKKHYKENKEIKILDIACGAGYGAAMLRSRGYVIGVDYDLNVLREAKVNFKITSLIQADALYLPFKDKFFDIVVSFETIEHVIDGDKFLSEMKRVLKDEGLFICSTPNIKYTAHPPFHLKEYYPEEFFSLLKKHFKNVEKYGQYFEMQDRLKDIFNWYVKNRFITILNVLRIKNKLKYIKNKLFIKDKKVNKNINRYELIKSIIKEGNHPVYGVREFYGNKNLLRIMIGVCQK